MRMNNMFIIMLWIRKIRLNAWNNFISRYFIFHNSLLIDRNRNNLSYIFEEFCVKFPSLSSRQFDSFQIYYKPHDGRHCWCFQLSAVPSKVCI